MRKRPLGATGIEVSELALGTWGLSGDGYGQVAEADQDAVIEKALALGITLFETADSYGRGAMERRLGERLPQGDACLVATKIGTDLEAAMPRKRFDPEYLKECAERSRERLKRDKIDVVLLHNPSIEALARGAATDALAELVQKGVARTWGVSAGSTEVVVSALACEAPVIELAYNAFHTRELATVAEVVRTKNTGILARSVLAYGLLAGAWPVSKEFPSGDHRAERWLGDDLRRRITQLNALRPSVFGSITSMRCLALRYVLANPLISSAVLGPRRPQQVVELVRDAGKDSKYLAEDTINALNLRVRNVGVKA